MGFHEPDPNGWEGPRTEPKWHRQGSYAGRPRPRPVDASRVEEVIEARREAEEDAHGDRDVW